MDGKLELNTYLAVRPAEFELAQDGVEYCGHVVGLGKQFRAQLKVRAIIDFSISRYKTQVKVLGYDRQYIPMFSRYRNVACFVTSSRPVPLKTRRVGQRCTLNLSRAETSSRWCGGEKETPYFTTLSKKIAQGNITASCKRLISWFLLFKGTELGRKIVPVGPPKF
ncbi:hypothetical protein TNCV_2675251 [Trichonephila clavipes]|nr:hypothetical protein TNCV_2675251 [Trichonephila clavipes]